MNRLARTLVCVGCAAAAAASCADTPNTPKEATPMNKKAPPGASRPAPPVVAPVEFEGVRYEQDMDARNHGGDQPGGYLVAIDPASNQRLWMLKVYRVPPPANPNVPHFGRHFKRMTLVAGQGAIEIENEVGGVYRVDLKARTSSWVSGPDSKP